MCACVLRMLVRNYTNDLFVFSKYDLFARLFKVAYLKNTLFLIVEKLEAT